MKSKNQSIMHEHTHDGSCCNHVNHVEAVQNNEVSHTHNHCSCEEHGEEEDVGDQHSKFKFKIVGLDCANCAMKVEKRILKEQYVKKAVVNFSSEMLYVDPTVKIEEEALMERLLAVIDEVEPGVRLVPVSEETEISHIVEIVHLLAGVVIFLLAFYLEDKIDINPLFLFLVPYLFIGYEVLWKSVRNILKGEIFDENFLMSIATIGAFVVGSYEEAVEVMLFYSIGELFQSFAVDKSRKSIASLLDIKSEYANLVVDNNESKKVDPKDLSVGDLIYVRVGERVPVDGIVEVGNSSLDMSALNGEAALRDVGVKDEVLAGAINMSGLIRVKVSKTYENSTVAKILELVENAANKKAPIETFITKFAKVYTPIVVLLAVLLVFIPSILFGFDSFYTYLYRGCTFLVISCPCALVISIPLGMFAGIGSASRIGALVKGGNYLELLNRVDYIIFDKTGTITKGNFNVSSIHGDKDILRYAAYGESYSTHPIAQSIVHSYNGEIDFKHLSTYQELAGFGIQVKYKEKWLFVGNERLMQKEHISFDVAKEIGSIIHVAYDGKYLGYIVIKDEIKETSKEALQELHQLGITSVMLSGDHSDVVAEVAREVGIDHVHGQLLPQDKVHLLEDYMKQAQHGVAFVGDGINDAPALMQADVGISMGGVGSDVAIAASDIVLISDDLKLIPKTIKISKKTKYILKQNIAFAIGVKVLVLILTTFGIANMKMGVFADVGVTLIAILNSMRILNSYKSR